LKDTTSGLGWNCVQLLARDQFHLPAGAVPAIPAELVDPSAAYLSAHPVSGRSIRHVLVKFSPGGTDALSRRWADLLVSEHLATRALRRAELTSATTELLAIDARVTEARALAA